MLLYRRWLKHGDAVFEALSSPVITEALNAAMGRVECVVLPHTYRHLSPLVSDVRRAPQRVEKGATRGDDRSARPPPSPLNPLVDQQHLSTPVKLTTRTDRNG